MRSPAPGCRSLIARATHVDLPKISQPCVPTTGACPKYTRVIASRSHPAAHPDQREQRDVVRLIGGGLLRPLIRATRLRLGSPTNR